jgi:hypothetical protein
MDPQSALQVVADTVDLESQLVLVRRSEQEWKSAAAKLASSLPAAAAAVENVTAQRDAAVAKLSFFESAFSRVSNLCREVYDVTCSQRVNESTELAADDAENTFEPVVRLLESVRIGCRELRDRAQNAERALRVSTLAIDASASMATASQLRERALQSALISAERQAQPLNAALLLLRTEHSADVDAAQARAQLDLESSDSSQSGVGEFDGGQSSSALQAHNVLLQEQLATALAEAAEARERGERAAADLEVARLEIAGLRDELRRLQRTLEAVVVDREYEPPGAAPQGEQAHVALAKTRRLLCAMERLVASQVSEGRRFAAACTCLLYCAPFSCSPRLLSVAPLLADGQALGRSPLCVDSTSKPAPVRRWKPPQHCRGGRELPELPVGRLVRPDHFTAWLEP